MKSYEPPSDEEDYGGRRKKKAKKDPNKPKRNMSAFFLYSNAVRSTVKEENPEAKFGDIAKVILWIYQSAFQSIFNESSLFFTINILDHLGSI